MTKKSYTIDATGKKLGRIASEAAKALSGKSEVAFTRNTSLPIEVSITNASKIDLRDKKANDTQYVTYSGYPGGIKFANMKQIVATKGISELLKIAIRGMIPSNKLRNDRMKRLSITE